MSAFEKLPAIPRIGSLGKAVSPPRTKRWCVQRIDVDRASSDGAQLHAVYCTHNISAIILESCAFDGVLDRDVPELGPLVDLAAR